MSAVPVRRWVPEDYCDEFTPAPRASVNDWVTRLEDGAFALAGAGTGGDPKPLTDGEIVAFAWTEMHGTGQLSFSFQDGGWTAEPAMPGDPPGGYMNVAVSGDYETASPDIDTLIDCLGPSETTVAVEYYAWSGEAVPFAFDASSGTFRPL